MEQKTSRRHENDEERPSKKQRKETLTQDSLDDEESIVDVDEEFGGKESYEMTGDPEMPFDVNVPAFKPSWLLSKLEVTPEVRL